jgi:hypothetical protein
MRGHVATIMPVAVCLKSSAPKARSLLVILQQHELVRRAFERYFGLEYERVRSTASPEETEELLSGSDGEPIDLIVGQELGPQQPTGTVLIQRWRRLFPQLRRVVMATAVEDVPPSVEGADAVYKKPFEPARIKEFLRGGNPLPVR